MLPFSLCDSVAWCTTFSLHSDKCTLCSSVGVLGLENLLFFGQNQQDKFRNIVNAQSTKADEGYPVAVVGIR